MIAGTDGFGYTDDWGQTWSMRWRIRDSEVVVPDAFAADPLDRDVVYAVMSFAYNYNNPPPYSLVRSADAGVTFEPWSSIGEAPVAMAVSTDGSRIWLASAGRHLWQSHDVGAAWQAIAEMPFDEPRQIAVSPRDPRILYAISGDGYLWVYREPDE